MADKDLDLIEKMIIVGERTIDQCKEELILYSELDEEMLNSLATVFKKYDIAKITGSLMFAEARLKAALDRQTIDVETLKEWHLLEDFEKTRPEEIQTFLEAIKSLRRTTKLLKAMRQFLVKVSDMTSDLEIIIGEMMGEEE